MKVKYAIVGCGRIAWNHLDGIEKSNSSVLCAVCDVDEAKARETGEKYGVNWYTDEAEMLEKEKIDVCCILTPSGLHAECGIIAAEHGVNVLCEKPMDVTREKMKALIDSCKKNGVKLGCIFQRRTFSAAIAMKKAVKDGVFGKVTLCDAYLKYYRDQAYYDSGDWRGTWELDGGGALMNQGIHGVDLIDWMTGGIKSVFARCERLNWKTDVEDTAVIMVRYKNGAMGVIECATTVYPGLDTVFTIGGTEGFAEIGNKGIYKWEMKDKSIEKPETTGTMGGLNCTYTDNLHAYQIEDMSRAILDNRDPMVTGEQALHSVGLILAIYESARTGKEVFIED